MFFWLQDTSDISEEDMKGFVHLAISELVNAHRSNKRDIGDEFAKGRLKDMVATHEMWLKASKAVLENPDLSAHEIYEKVGL